MGQRPSHPELLDWLAVEFRESGWDIKHMYKLMVMSAAYRQSAVSTPQQLARDPKEPSPGSWPALPHGCRDAAGYRPPIQRAVDRQDRRSQR